MQTKQHDEEQKIKKCREEQYKNSPSPDSARLLTKPRLCRGVSAQNMMRVRDSYILIKMTLKLTTKTDD